MAEITLAEQAAELRELREKRDDAIATAETLKADYKAAEAALFERFANDNVDGIKTAGYNFVPSRTVYGRVTDRDKLREWAEANAPDLFQPKEVGERLHDYVRAALDDGRELPPGLGFRVREYISQRAA